MKIKATVTLSERQIRSLAADASIVAATTVLYAPDEEKRAHAAAVRILNKFTDWRKSGRKTQ